MTPDDFKFDLLHHAFALRQAALTWSKSNDLDPKTSVWVVTGAAWREFRASEDIMCGDLSIDHRTCRITLMGLPVRITINDEEGTPPVQLFMEPMFEIKRMKTG